MSEWKLVKLKFGRSPAHFGELGIGIEETSERVRSDTLFSAWITAYAQLFGGNGVSQLLAQFDAESEPPFHLSSTFIYQEINSGTVYYLPRPKMFPNKYPIGNDLDFAKDYKKLNYLPLETWRKWYQTEIGFLKEDLQVAAIKAYGNAFKIDRIPKVAIDRTTRATNLYHTGFVQFDWKLEGNSVKILSGLYFLLYFPSHNPKLERELKATLSFLGEEGLGGERSSGAGRFEVEWHDSLPYEWKNVSFLNVKAQHYVLLSMFWTDDSAQLSSLGLNADAEHPASYELQERGGWITSPFSGHQLRRKSVQMFTEGSVFSSTPKGKLVNVSPDEFKMKDGNYKPHPIYRSGIALSLPIYPQNI